jgi:DDE superfamily endonuclease/Helix-turn-helix of DDE superfamily endonuclease
VYHATGFTKDRIRDICAMVRLESRRTPTLSWPPILGLFRSVVVTLTYLRRNRVQVELAETFDVSQPTISRAIAALTGVLGRMLTEFVTLPADLDERRQYIVDGTLLPCWSQAGRRELYSRKHNTTGLSVQVVCSHDGTLARISDPIDGSRRDSYALRECGLVDPSPRTGPLRPHRTACGWLCATSLAGRDSGPAIRARVTGENYRTRNLSLLPVVGSSTNSSFPSSTAFMR